MKVKLFTLEDFLERPETRPASEFIDGQIIQKPMPQGKHSAIQGDFVPTVNQDDLTLSVFEHPPDTLPVPAFASAVQLTVGDVFSWLQD